MRLRPVLLALAAGVVLADTSIVTLALPELLGDLDTTIEGLAAVLGVYTAVLALVLVPLGRVAAAFGVRTLGAAGFLLLAGASVVCAEAQSLTVLLVARGAQALGGAAGLMAAFAVLHVDGGRNRRLWVAAAVVATAAGPALGGLLTEAFDWRAIFVAQIPLALLGAAAAALGPAPALHADWEDEVESAAGPRRFGVRPAAALALVSAALTAVLFLLVLLLVAGWGESPLHAALAVTILPVGALLGSRIGGEPWTRAASGCVLVAGGVLALTWLPDAHVAWTFAPQAVAGLGMGLSLTALAGGLLPERTVHDAAWTLTLRHLGIAGVLALLAPIASAQLDDTTAQARARGVAVVLDARLPPEEKLSIAPALLRGVDTDRPRNGLRQAAARERDRVDAGDRPVYDRALERVDEVLVDAVGRAFRTSFLITGALALLAALLLATGARAPLALIAAAAVAIALPVAAKLVYDAQAPPPVQLADPCKPRRLPGTGGVGGFLQDRVLEILDRSACDVGSSREELVLALADPQDARRFEDEYGTSPRDAIGILGVLLPDLGGG
ncbi:MAG TPA: MFS transporter [Solirubrobacteraceae bacterium]|nr:MFS transporter [Solirubrobacteraceae bacterium]